MVDKSSEFEPKNRKDLVAIIIRMNDLTKVASEFDKFKQKCISLMDEQLSARVDSVFEDYLRSII